LGIIERRDQDLLQNKTLERGNTIRVWERVVQKYKIVVKISFLILKLPY